MSALEALTRQCQRAGIQTLEFVHMYVTRATDKALYLETPKSRFVDAGATDPVQQQDMGKTISTPMLRESL